MKNSGTIDITLQEAEHDSIKMARTRDETHQDAVYSDTRRQQGTQTIPVTDVLNEKSTRTTLTLCLLFITPLGT